MINLGTSTMQDFALGDALVERIDLGVTTIFDPYTTLTGTLPLSFNSHVAGALKNYRVFGTAAGAGVETINLLDINATDTSNGYVPNAYLNVSGEAVESEICNVSEYIPVNSGTRYSYCSVRKRNEAAICFYDSSKQFLSYLAYTYTRPRNFIAPSNAAYVRISIYDNRDMLLLGEYDETPNFEPYGYKIPLLNTSGVTENLFDKSATDTNNGYLSDRYITNTGVTQNNQNYIVSEYIPCNGNTTYYLSSLVNSGTATALCFYDQSYGFISGERILNATNVTSPADAAYIRTTVQKETLDSAMISEIYLPSYIPHRYTSNYKLFIGSTKLGEEEYTDFGEQKIYKRTENEFDYNSSDLVGYPNTSIGATGQTDYWTGTGSGTVYRYPIEPNTDYCLYTQLSGVEVGLYRVAITASSLPPTKTQRRVAPWQYNGSEFANVIFNSGSNTFVLIQVSTSYDIDSYFRTVSLIKTDVAPDHFIPYLQPTDPPAPLPPIIAYEGENTLSDPMVQTEAYSFEQGNYGGNPGEQLFKHNSSHDYFNKAIRVSSILTVPAGQKWLIATKIDWATTIRIANSSGIVISTTGSNGTTANPIVIEASTSERKLGIHTSHLVNGSVVQCVPSDYGGDLDITVVDAGALGSMTIKGRINSMI